MWIQNIECGKMVARMPKQDDTINKFKNIGRMRPVLFVGYADFKVV